MCRVAWTRVCGGCSDALNACHKMGINVSIGVGSNVPAGDCAWWSCGGV